MLFYRTLQVLAGILRVPLEALTGILEEGILEILAGILREEVLEVLAVLARLHTESCDSWKTDRFVTARNARQSHQ